MRFADLFEDEDFEIDETSEEYLLQKPHQMKLERKRKQQEEASVCVELLHGYILLLPQY